jgi:hypothetical protein
MSCWRRREQRASDDILAQENVFWFEVAMDDAALLEYDQGLEDLPQEYTNEVGGEALVLVLRDELKQVDA